MEDFRTIDFETHLFAPGRMAPRPVVLAELSERREARLHVGQGMFNVLRRCYDRAADGVPVAGQYVAYDNAVAMEAWPELTRPIFGAYDAGGVVDTRIAEKLIDLARGRHGAGGRKYSLEDMARRRLGLTMDKDTWRLHYAELDGVPLDRWPEGAKEYPLGDVRATADLLRNQFARATEIGYSLPDLDAQCRASFALHLMGCWGVRTDGEYVARFRAGIAERLEALRPELRAAGLMDARGKRSNKRLQEIALAELGAAAPRTPKGKIKIDADTLADLDHPAAVLWKSYAGLEKVDSTYLVPLEAGASAPIHARWNELVDSGRTSCGSPNWQNPPRGGVAVGGDPAHAHAMDRGRCACGAAQLSVRECVVARPGFVLVASDFDSQEMRCWAQACLTIAGRSRLAERYRSDPDFDPHTALASTALLRCSEEEGLARKKAGDPTLKKARQSAKIPNFGLPGGMGVGGLIRYARGYGERWADPKGCAGCAAELGGARQKPGKYVAHHCYAAQLRDAWFRQWPEAADYFSFVSSLVGQGSRGDVTQLVSGRRRGLCGYTDGANTLFQGLAADASKAALYEVARRCYSVETSALYGCRPILFVHDEVIVEAPEWWAHEAAVELEEAMCEQMARYVPDVPTRASAHLMRRWHKGAEAVRDAGGRLVPWEDRAR